MKGGIRCVSSSLAGGCDAGLTPMLRTEFFVYLNCQAIVVGVAPGVGHARLRWPTLALSLSRTRFDPACGLQVPTRREFAGSFLLGKHLRATRES